MLCERSIKGRITGLWAKTPGLRYNWKHSFVPAFVGFARAKGATRASCYQNPSNQRDQTDEFISYADVVYWPAPFDTSDPPSLNDLGIALKELDAQSNANPNITSFDVAVGKKIYTFQFDDEKMPPEVYCNLGVHRGSDHEVYTPDSQFRIGQHQSRPIIDKRQNSPIQIKFFNEQGRQKARINRKRTANDTKKTCYLCRAHWCNSQTCFIVVNIDQPRCSSLAASKIGKRRQHSSHCPQYSSQKCCNTSERLREKDNPGDQHRSHPVNHARL